MIRAASVLLAVVLLLGLGYLAGRLPSAVEVAKKAPTLPDDDALDGPVEVLVEAGDGDRLAGARVELEARGHEVTQLRQSVN